MLQKKVASLLPPEFYDSKLCVSLRNVVCKELTCFVLPISNLCHFLCLLEECFILRTNYLGRHPVPYKCSEI